MNHYIIALYVLDKRAVILKWDEVTNPTYIYLDVLRHQLNYWRDKFSNPGFEVRLEVNPLLTEDIINSVNYQDELVKKKALEAAQAEKAMENKAKQDVLNDPAFAKAISGVSADIVTLDKRTMDQLDRLKDAIPQQIGE